MKNSHSVEIAVQMPPSDFFWSPNKEILKSPSRINLIFFNTEAKRNLSVEIEDRERHFNLIGHMIHTFSNNTLDVYQKFR